MVYKHFGFESKNTIEIRKTVDKALNDSINYVKKTNEEYIDVLRKRNLK